MNKPPEMAATKWAEILGVFARNRGEAVLLFNAWIADVIQVQEVGANLGLWVERFQRAAGVPPGSPWCASVITYIFKCLGMPVPKNPGRVRSWVEYAKENGALIPKAIRSALVAMLHKNGTGHMGQALGTTAKNVQSIEGNTSPGLNGSQRDGDGHYRRSRPATYWQFAIDINKLP